MTRSFAASSYSAGGGVIFAEIASFGFGRFHMLLLYRLR